MVVCSSFVFLITFFSCLLLLLFFLLFLLFTFYSLLYVLEEIFLKRWGVG